MVMRDSPVNHSTLSPRNARVGDGDIEPAIEVCNNVIDGLLYEGLVSDVNLVGAACTIPVRSHITAA